MKRTALPLGVLAVSYCALLLVAILWERGAL